MTHLLVTNDFPPKVGGIQSYLYERWRRLPADEVVVLTTAHPDAAAFDARQPFRIERQPGPFLVPSPGLVSRIGDIAEDAGADLVLLDPVWPLGAIGPQLDRPFGVVLHGSEITVPGNLPFVQLLARRTLRAARLVVAAGGYPATEAHRVAGRPVPTVVSPPGVDAERFVPLTAEARAQTRAELGIEPDAAVVLGVSRLVPRKGFDVLLQAARLASEEHPELHVVIAGDGRDRSRLEQLAVALEVRATILGPVEADRLPAIYGSADVFAMLCRTRWFGLEQEGFGIVFLEAAAAGLPSIAGRSGGSDEAVLDGQTGLVVDEPRSVPDVADALMTLLDDPARRGRMGVLARARAERDFSEDALAEQLRVAIAAVVDEIRAERTTAAPPAGATTPEAGAEGAPVEDAPVEDAPAAVDAATGDLP